MQTFNLTAYNNATFRWTLDVSQLGPFFDAGGKLHMIGALPTGVTYEWIQGAASGGIITVSNVAGVYTARFTAPLADVRNWFGRMRFDCRGELPSGAAEPVMSGTITFEQGRTRAAGDPASTAVDTYFDTVDGGGPALVLPVDWGAALNAANGYASAAAASAAAASAAAAIAISNAASALGAASSSRNRLRNASFAINQRAVSGTVTLAAGAYGHDGLKAGAAGATYTFATSGLDTTITILVGSLILPIEESLIEGGVYTLAHDGSAQARIWQGPGYSGSGSYVTASRAGGGLQSASLTAATQTNVEFSTGTVLRPQIEPGALATAFERRPIAIETVIGHRYYQRLPLQGVLGEATSSSVIFCALQFPAMRAAPTGTLLKTSISGASYELAVGWSFVTATGLTIAYYGAGPASCAFQWVGFSGLSFGGLAAGNGVADLLALSAEL